MIHPNSHEFINIINKPLSDIALIWHLTYTPFFLFIHYDLRGSFRVSSQNVTNTQWKEAFKYSHRPSIPAEFFWISNTQQDNLWCW